MILDPKLVFLNQCPQHILDAYERLRTALDEYMVNMAEEVAKRDKIEASLKSTRISEARGQHKGKENHATN